MMHFTMHTLLLGLILKNFHHKQRGRENVNFCPLTFPPHLAHISSSIGSNYLVQTQQLTAYTYMSSRRMKNEPEEDEK